MNMTKSVVLGRLVKMIALGSSAYLCLHLGIKRTPYMETALIPVLVSLTALSLGIAALYQLTYVWYTLLGSRTEATAERE